MKTRKLLIDEVGKSFDPATVKFMGDAFDSAWAEVDQQFSACDVRASQRAKLVMAEAILAHATNETRDVGHLRHVALRALVPLYPWLFEEYRKQA